MPFMEAERLQFYAYIRFAYFLKQLLQPCKEWEKVGRSEVALLVVSVVTTSTIFNLYIPLCTYTYEYIVEANKQKKKHRMSYSNVDDLV